MGRTKTLVAVMCLLAVTAGVALARPVAEIQEDLKEAQRELSGLRWHEFQNVAAKLLGENEEYQAALEKVKATQKAQDDGTRALAEETEEGKALYVKLDRLEAELKELTEANDPGKGEKAKEVRETQQELRNWLRENEITSWKNERYVAIARPRTDALNAQFAKGMALLKALDNPEAQDFVAKYEAADKKVETLKAELKEAQATERAE
jgi:hypothetical protein